MAQTHKTREKRDLLEKLRILLVVAGNKTSWEDLAAELRELPLYALRALHYRIDRARAEAFDEGTQHRGGLNS